MSIVKKYKAEVISIASFSDKVYMLELKSLSGKFKYRPGQYLHLSVDHDYDGIGQWPESRCYSMQSNPASDTIKITYAVKGKYTKQMEGILHINSEVWLKLPYGDLFTQQHNKLNTVFIAGGTGITPFLSLFTHESFKEYIDPRIYLGFRSGSYNIYQDELSAVKSCDPKIYYEDVNGLLDINLIFSENGISSDYFISGPPVMIKLFKQALFEKGVPVTRILTDDWE